MRTMLLRKHPFWTSHRDFFREVAMSLVLVLALCGTALGQQIQVSGMVTSEEGVPLQGVAVRVQGTDVSTNTDASGRYTLTAPSDGVLVVNFIGYRTIAVRVGGRTAIDIIMEEAIAVLGEVVVTGYTEERRGDITGAISTVEITSVQRQSTASVLQRLDGRVAGVQVEASGNPGGRSTVRIRGVSSFQNNDPLYIIDGTPVQESYLNFLNPNDIESIQVLKDASAASIYGVRAVNGVVIIQTIRGSEGAPRFSVDVKAGMSTPVRGYDDFLITDALEYHEVVRRGYVNAGQPVPENIFGDPDNPSVPAYIWPNDGVVQTQAGDVDESAYVWGDPNNQDGMIMRGSPGTNWWDAVFGPALTLDANVGVSGGGTGHRYTASFNYLNQEGTAVFNRFQRGSIRVNTEFDVGIITLGENMSFSMQESFGGRGDGGAEGGIMGKNILSQPVVPVYTIKGEELEAAGEDPGPHYASGKCVTCGNNTNPAYTAWAGKENKYRQKVLFGNVFAGLNVTDGLRLRTSLGFNLSDAAQTSYSWINPTHSEPTFTDGLSEFFDNNRFWTWANTLTYGTTLGERHDVELLLGHEASKGTYRSLSANINNLITNSIDAWYIRDAIGDPDTKNVNSYGGMGSLLSFFGKIDYKFADRYHANFTVRRDGSSAFAEGNRWSTFPAFSVGWRLSEEPFLQGNEFFTNIMLRFGWGITGNENIPSGRIASQFGGSIRQTYYDIAGTGGTPVSGFRQTSLGNADLKWEENESMNLGLDLEFFGGSASLVVDVYQRDTDNLLFAPPTPATAGLASAPIVNIGQMRNRGIDFSIGFTGSIGAGDWGVTLNGSTYKNEIMRIDGVQDFFYGESQGARYGFKSINQVGHPVGAFHGLISDGLFLTQDEVDERLPIDPDAAVPVCPGPCQDGAALGRLKFRDVNEDGIINADDRTIMGDPHPDFVGGLDLELNWGAWDFSATIFGTFGNDILDVNKQFYIFQNFSTNVRRDMLTDAAVVENGEVVNKDAKYPRLDRNDTFSGQQVSSFYVEDGSYVRLRNLQIGYLLPQTLVSGARVYLQAENLFTITGYSGLDPALPARAVSQGGADVRDQYRGWDRGSYPSNRIISLGINVTF
ncbi:MAG: TonB-dependent receptor [Gemmatimonadota bacterium]|nr:MAG: TonB-dependent receptor [Gemmatimonadota bacterium]